MIRRIKNLAAKSHPAFLSKHVMFKYVLQRTLSWAEESKNISAIEGWKAPAAEAP